MAAIEVEASRRETACATCAHCGLPVPAGDIDPDSPISFCCAGCRAVYHAIREYGLDRYYELLDPDERPANVSGRSFEELDDDAFIREHARVLADGSIEVDLLLEGVHCAACVWIVERLPRVVAGVLDSRLDLRRKRARVRFDPERVRLSRISRTLDSFGYTPHPWRSRRLEEVRRAEQRRALIRLGVAFACAGNAMLISWALYAGEASGMDRATRTLLRSAGLLLTATAVLWPGAVFLVGAVQSLRARVLHMDVPVAIALTLGLVWGGINTLRDAGQVYFESLTAVVMLLLVGRWIQERQQRHAHDALSLLFSMTDGRAFRVDPDGLRPVAVESLRPGDLVRVRSGDTVPADGVLRSPAAVIDESVLTGESMPVPRRRGDAVTAGAINHGGVFDLEITAVGERTRVGRLMAEVDQLGRRKPAIVRFADRMAHAFVLVVLSLAAVTLALWWSSGPTVALEHTIALLIVTCPCALGLATPLAIQAASGRAARAGILIKDSDAIERLAGGGEILLDKTGTVTRGRARALLVYGSLEAAQRAAALERDVHHPIAAAIRARFASGDALDVADLRHTPGGGVRGVVEGVLVHVGSRRFMEREGIPIPALSAAAAEASARRGASPVFVAESGSISAVLEIGDELRPDARAAIRALERHGLSPALLSGDDPMIVRRVARQIGVRDARGGATPESKVEEIRRRQACGKTVFMVGDGLNDAAALVAADVGIAVHGGAEASLAAADVYLSREGLSALADLIRGSRRTMRVIRRNFAASLAYNAICATLAVAGAIHPIVAAVLMPLSSLTVVFLSYRSRTF